MNKKRIQIRNQAKAMDGDIIEIMEICRSAETHAGGSSTAVPVQLLVTLHFSSSIWLRKDHLTSVLPRQKNEASLGFNGHLFRDPR